jgi:hypothetical protein
MGWGCAAMLAVTPLGIVVRGAVLQQLWGWFVVPLGVTAISLPWALGLAGLAYLMVGTMQPRDAKKGEDPREAALKAAVDFMAKQHPRLADEMVKRRQARSARVS